MNLVAQPRDIQPSVSAASIIISSGSFVLPFQTKGKSSGDCVCCWSPRRAVPCRAVRPGSERLRACNLPAVHPSTLLALLLLLLLLMSMLLLSEPGE